MSMKRLSTAMIVLAALLALAACGGEQPAPTEQTAEQPTQGDLPAGHPPVGQSDPSSMMPAPVVGQGAALAWSMPDGWVDEPPANVMRQAQFRVPSEAGDGQCVIYYFGAGQGGTPVANAERWADQFDQPDGSSSRDVLITEETEVNGMATLMVEVTGTYKEGGMMMTGAPEEQRPDYMLLGAVVQGPDANWFFKFTGPEETVRANADQFNALVQSVRSSG